MSVKQSVSACLDSAIGEYGLSESALSGWLARLGSRFERLKTEAASRSLPHIRVLYEEADLAEAQAAYAAAIENADMILMLCTMLHAIGTGNMTPAGVRLVCVDIAPSVVTKLADRGSVESTGIVTDVGLFLHLLAQRLSDD